MENKIVNYCLLFAESLPESLKSKNMNKVGLLFYRFIIVRVDEYHIAIIEQICECKYQCVNVHTNTHKHARMHPHEHAHACTP